jgi:hypothetical protein
MNGRLTMVPMADAISSMCATHGRVRICVARCVA